MSGIIRITSSGRLVYDGSESVLRESFCRSNPRGLLSLLSVKAAPEDSEIIQYFRRIVKDAVLRILNSDSGEIDPGKLADSAPPCPGGLPVSPQIISNLLQDLNAHISSMSALENLSTADWLRHHLPGWDEVGKVGFHLAENKNDRDGQHPFAFLATYIHGLTEHGTPRHLPLKQALAKYSGDAQALLNFLSPIKTASEKSGFLKELSDSGALFRPALWSSDTAWHFLRDVPVFQEAGILVRMTEIWKKPRPKLHLEIGMDVQRKKGVPLSETLTQFSIKAALGDKELSGEELAEIMNTKGGLIRIKGEWVEADTGHIAALMRKWSAISDFAGHTGIPFLQSLKIIAGAGALSSNAVPVPEQDPLCTIQPGESFRELLMQSSSDSWRSSTEMPDIPAGVHAQLRPYQKQGVRFLCGMTTLGMGACLADDMGLGKTLQVLTFLEIQREKGLFREKQLPALIIMPASLLENWHQEAAKFVPGLRFGILHNAVLSAAEKDLLANQPEKFFGNYDALALSYAASRLPVLQDFEFPAILLDEAQFIKNASSAQSKTVRSLRAPVRIAMTGTPVENNLGDLWSIFDFIQPGLLGEGTAFREFVHAMEAGKNGKSDYSPLRKLVRPYIMRRLKSDKSIIHDLPDKCESKTWCSLTEIQAKLYVRCVDAMKKELAMAEDSGRNGIILGYLSQFKQICNHPSQFSGNGDFSADRSGKFLRLKELASDIAQCGEKLLVFTQYREMTEPLHDLLASVFGRTGLILHGGTSLADRARFVEAFQDAAGPSFFVLSLKAAGTGLNLTAANHVIHFDRWWNPAVENQATDRAYRIGQHQNVMVHKFIVKGTLEEKIDSMISGKIFLSNSILSGGPGKSLLDLSNNELLDLVRLESNLKGDLS